MISSQEELSHKTSKKESPSLGTLQERFPPFTPRSYGGTQQPQNP